MDFFRCSRSIRKKDKIERLTSLIQQATMYSNKHDFDCLLTFANNVNWVVIDTRGIEVEVPPSQLNLVPYYDRLREEFLTRKNFFALVVQLLGDTLMSITNTREQPYMEWGTKNQRAMKLAEFIQALNRLPDFHFSPGGERHLKAAFEEIFDLGETNWANIEADMRKWKNKEWPFLKELLRIS
jgi:hypothetical protein